ncbi:hypothetical protein MHB42_03255 [Lysinibacillus sp. FSL K6-0232]|uniref:hypothetical protein n=1 Tax=Lysinibacillus sp. FSL K6-0232 TaxID=2921425 RepID=UPI0030F7FB21
MWVIGIPFLIIGFVNKDWTFIIIGIALSTAFYAGKARGKTKNQLRPSVIVFGFFRVRSKSSSQKSVTSAGAFI